MTSTTAVRPEEDSGAFFVGLPWLDVEAHRELSAAARALGARALPAQERPRWQVGEDDIVVASISVILVALFAIIAVAAAAILTMG